MEYANMLLDWSSTSKDYDHQSSRIDLEKICKEKHLSVSIYKFADERDVKRKNCFAYALNLEPYGEELWTPEGDDISTWIQNGQIVKDPCGNITIYFNSTDIPIHMGINKGSLIESKWGKSHVCLHALNDSPYGSFTERFSVTNREQLLKSWKDVAEQMAKPPTIF